MMLSDEAVKEFQPSPKKSTAKNSLTSTHVSEQPVLCCSAGYETVVSV